MGGIVPRADPIVSSGAEGLAAVFTLYTTIATEVGPFSPHRRRRACGC